MAQQPKYWEFPLKPYEDGIFQVAYDQDVLECVGTDIIYISELSAFLQDASALAKNWAIASEAYEPDSDLYCNTRDVFQARLEMFQSKLTRVTNPDTVSLITAVAGEIGNNSFDHNLGNWPDIPGIFFHIRCVIE